MIARPLAGVMAAALVAAMASCDGGPAGSPTPGPSTLVVEPQNSTFLVGVNRISVALLTSDPQPKPVTGATAVTVEIQGGHGTFETAALQDVGPGYGMVPVYVGAARLPQTGSYRLVVHATLTSGTRASGNAVISVAQKAPEIPVGAPVPALRQPIASDPGVRMTAIDSGVPPDPWHTATIADGLAQHRPMVLYFGEPGFCRSRTCGPTVQVLQQLCAQYCSRLLFEHIEDNYPAGPDLPSGPTNPAFVAFGLQSEPWIYFVNGTGVVADRFEGPATVDELRTAAEGTLAGRVPAVDIPLS